MSLDTILSNMDWKLFEGSVTLFLYASSQFEIAAYNSCLEIILPYEGHH